MQKIRPARYFGRFLASNRLFLSAPLIAVILFAGGLFGYNYTTVKTVEVRGPKGMQLVGLDALKHKSLILIQNEYIKRVIQEQNPTVKSISSEKVYPDLLILSPEFYSSVAYLIAGEGYLVVSSDGKVLKKSREVPPGLVGVRYYQKLNYDVYQSGQTVDYTDLKNGLAALKIARDLGMKVESVDIDGTNMIRLQLDDKVLLLSSQKSMQLQAYQLEKLVRQFALEGKKYSSIDVRFEKPVVKFAK